MRFSLMLATLLAHGLALGQLHAEQAKEATPAKKADSEQIDKLITQLGSTDFEVREKATEGLRALGMQALQALRKASKSTDTEVRQRATKLLANLEKQVTSKKLLTPTRIRLVYKDVSVQEAIADIQKKTGFRIRLHDPKNQLKDKKITLDTGETTFWNAMEQFCAQAGLVESAPHQGRAVRKGPVGGIGVPVPLPIPVKRVPIRIRGKAPAILPVAPPKDAPMAKEKPAEDKPADKKPARKAEPAKKTKPAKGAARAPRKLKAVAKATFAPRGAAAPPGKPAPPAPPKPPVPVARPVPVPAPPVARPILIGGRPALPGTNPGEIILTPGKPTSQPADTSSSVRVRVVDKPIYGKAPADQVILPLQITPEPRLRWHQTLGLKLTKVLDDQGQKLSEVASPARPGAAGIGGVAPPPVAPGAPARIIIRRVGFGGFGLASAYHYHPLRLKKGPKPAKKLLEVRGVLTGLVLQKPETVLTVKNLAATTGKTFKGKNGTTLMMMNARNRRGTFYAQFQLDFPKGWYPDNTPPTPAKKAAKAPAVKAKVVGGAARVVIRGGGAVFIGGSRNNVGVTVYDAKGNVVPASISRGIRFVGGVQQSIYTMYYRPRAGMGQPARLVVRACKGATIDVPFTLKNVPMP